MVILFMSHYQNVFHAMLGKNYSTIFVSETNGSITYGPRRETCLRGFANNTGADQPAHPRSLISAFVIRLMESIICKLATGEISIFQLVSVAEETGLSLVLSGSLKTGIVTTRPIWS